MRYVVLMNNKYMNSFKFYGDAVDLKNRLLRDYINAFIEIITFEEFKGRV